MEEQKVTAEGSLEQNQEFVAADEVVTPAADVNVAEGDSGAVGGDAQSEEAPAPVEDNQEEVQ